MQADAIVVLGCRVDDRGVPAPALSRRLMRALTAYRQGVAATVVCSGGKVWPGGMEAVVMWRWLVDRGVPAEHVCMEVMSRSTWENALFSSQIAMIRGWRHVAVVSCDWHLRRVQRNFHRVAPDLKLLPLAAVHDDRPAHDRIIVTGTEAVSTVLDTLRHSFWRLTCATA